MAGYNRVPGVLSNGGWLTIGYNGGPSAVKIGVHKEEVCFIRVCGQMCTPADSLWDGDLSQQLNSLWSVLKNQGSSCL